MPSKVFFGTARQARLEAKETLPAKLDRDIPSAGVSGTIMHAVYCGVMLHQLWLKNVTSLSGATRTCGGAGVA